MSPAIPAHTAAAPTGAAPTPSRLEAVFARLEAAAIAGDRCPENGCDGVRSDMISALARAGRIKVAISGHNYRTVTILTGPHAGKSTRPDPTGAHVWKVIGTETRVQVRRDVPTKARMRPSPPRPLTQAELHDGGEQ